MQHIANGVQLLSAGPAHVLGGVFEKVVRFGALGEAAHVALRGTRGVERVAEGGSAGGEMRGADAGAGEIQGGHGDEGGGDGS